MESVGARNVVTTRRPIRTQSAFTFEFRLTWSKLFFRSESDAPPLACHSTAGGHSRDPNNNQRAYKPALPSSSPVLHPLHIASTSHSYLTPQPLPSHTPTTQPTPFVNMPAKAAEKKPQSTTGGKAPASTGGKAPAAAKKTAAKTKAPAEGGKKKKNKARKET